MTGILLYSSHSQAYQNPLGPYIYLHYNPIFPCLVGPPWKTSPAAQRHRNWMRRSVCWKRKQHWPLRCTGWKHQKSGFASFFCRMTIHFWEPWHFLNIEKACKIWETGELPELFITLFFWVSLPFRWFNTREWVKSTVLQGKPVNHIVGEIPGVLILQWVSSQLFWSDIPILEKIWAKSMCIFAGKQNNFLV